MPPGRLTLNKSQLTFRGEVMLNSILMDIAENIVSRDEHCVSREQSAALIPHNSDQVMDLLSYANKIRQRFKQQKIFKCGIVNAKSGLCSEDCAFCAQSAHHQCPIDVYPLRGRAELIDTGLGFCQAGVNHYSIVTSGSSLSGGEIDTVCRAAETLRKKTDMKLCASLGLLDESSARRLKAAGVSRYHHNLETARSYFDQICTTHDYDDDLATLQAVRAAGMEICSGGIFGLGESWEQRLEMAFMLRELEVDSIPINFLNPIQGTRLGHRSVLPPLEALACIALFRFIHPRRDITICGGREITLKEFQSWLFFAGANGLMVGHYLTTRGRSIAADLEMIADLGLH